MKDGSFREFVLDQLAGAGPVRCRAMFGGHGLYNGDVFFGIIHDGRLYLKTDGRTRPAFEERGMRPFRPGPKQTLRNYYEVPPEVLESRPLLTDWARAAAPAAPWRRRSGPN